MTDIPTLTGGTSSASALLAQAAPTSSAPAASAPATSAIGSTATPGAVAATGTVAQSEYAVLRGLLSEFGLDSIYDKVRQFITTGASPAEMELTLREMPEYQERFKVIFDREKAGLPPVSAAEVVDYEAQLSQVFNYYGYPQNPGENLQETAANLLGGDVSMSEVQERLTAQMSYARRVLDDPANQGMASQLLGLGATLFDVADFALDPNKTLEQVERRLAAAEVANESFSTGFDTTADEALELARQGVTADQARQGFGVLQQQSQVVDRMIGDRDDPVSREQELAALSGDVEAQAAIERSAQKRVAAATVGGSFATGDEGFEGIR